MTDVPMIVPIAWYRRGDYADLLKLFTDGAKLPPTFDRWLERAEGVERQAKAASKPTSRVLIRPIHFAKWCEERKIAPNAQARLSFVNEEAARLYLQR